MIFLNLGVNDLIQTWFHELDKITSIEQAKPGYNKGSYFFIKAIAQKHDYKYFVKNLKKITAFNKGIITIKIQEAKFYCKPRHHCEFNYIPQSAVKTGYVDEVTMPEKVPGK